MKSLALYLLLSFTSANLFADWKADIEYPRLLQKLGAAVPRGVNQRFSQVEAPWNGGYTPMAGVGLFYGTGRFAGVIFNHKSGTSNGSGHATDVAAQCYGRSGYGGRDGIAYGVTAVDCYQGYYWFNSNMLKTSMAAPLVEVNDVVNTSFAAGADGQDVYYGNILRAADYSVWRDDYLLVTAMSNVASNAPPLLMASCYNGISVGLTSGGHSRGLTLANVDGPGRVKPEIVAPADYTSFAAPMVSGAALILREVATPRGANATHHLTIKAALLAGATKTEFPGWSRTPARPLDLIYGAGELNIWNSYDIMRTAEQNSNTVIAMNPTSSGWDLSTVTASTTQDYLLEVPAAMTGSQMSVMLVWDRLLEDSPASGFDLKPLPLANLALTLERKVNGVYTNLDTSNSSFDNLEHIYRPTVLAGSYRLRVTQSTATVGLGTKFAIAWRLTPPKSVPTLRMDARPGGYILSAEQLVPSQAYSVELMQKSGSWRNFQSFTATAPERMVLSAPVGLERQLYFRLVW